MERIKKNVGVPWREVTVDTIKGSGSPHIIVTGITTSFMATLDVLQKSVKEGNNLILTHEPAFWTNLDLGEGLLSPSCLPPALSRQMTINPLTATKTGRHIPVITRFIWNVTASMLN